MFLILSPNLLISQERKYKSTRETYVILDSTLNIDFQESDSTTYVEDDSIYYYIDGYDPEIFVIDSTRNLLKFHEYVEIINNELPYDITISLEISFDSTAHISQVVFHGFNYGGRNFPKDIDLVKILSPLKVKPYKQKPRYLKFMQVLNGKKKH